ncbi:MAG: DUF3267 domain-containing protein [Bacteroidia bacterium]|nr:DUF3267 domain-containing protein [Bacteroidia bacterium]
MLFFVYFETPRTMLNENDYDKTLKTISLEEANKLGVVLLIPVFVVFTGIHILLWGNDMLEYFRVDFSPLKILRDGFLFFIAFLIGIVLHELIHGISFALFAPGGFRSVRFGVLWKFLTPYCHCTEPLQVRHYIFGALTPSVILGFVPAILGLIIGKYPVTFFGIVFIVAAIGDFMVVRLLSNEKPTDYTQDHPSEAGCYVYRKK